MQNTPTRFNRPAATRWAARGGAVTVAAGLIVASATVPAGAHVTVTPDTTAAGSYALLTFSLGHGCDGSPTRQLTISIPESIPQPTPSVVAGWQVKKVDQKLDEPITDSHGSKITERVAEVVYTADQPLVDGLRQSFSIQAQLPEDAAGETLEFPVVQTCVKGETPWTEVAAEGQDPEELERPAPLIEVTEATEGDGHGAAASDSEDSADSKGDDAADTKASDSDDEGSSNLLGIGGLLLGAIGAVLGGAAFARTRKS